jgi:hypothetical protein
MAFDRVAHGEVVCPASIGQFDMGPTVAGSRSIFGYFIFRLRSRRAYNQGRAHWNTFLSIHPPPAQRNPEVRRAAFCTISVWARTGDAGTRCLCKRCILTCEPRATTYSNLFVLLRLPTFQLVRDRRPKGNQEKPNGEAEPTKDITNPLKSVTLDPRRLGWARSRLGGLRREHRGRRRKCKHDALQSGSASRPRASLSVS